MAKRSEAPVLSPRALNRALLARQMLLERAAMPVADAVAHLIALQAQIPSDPYFALWSRLADFDAEDLAGLIASRKAVRMTSLRGTVHLTTAEDARVLRPWVQPTITRLLASTPFGKNTKAADRTAVGDVARAVVDKSPVTLAHLRPTLAKAFPDFPANDLSYVFHYTWPLVQVPPRGLWRKSSAPKVTTLQAWLGKPLLKPSPEKILLRYLKAYGPATVADARSWSGVTNLAPVFERLRPKLVTFRDGRGMELFDLPDAPRPDADTPVPPRFLPIYDNAILGFANRDRIIAGGPDKPPPENAWVKSFLLDGYVAGFWKMAETKKKATLTIEPFAALSRKDKAALTVEGRALLKFATVAQDHEVVFTAP
jgi:hypothetical protein